MLAVGLLAAYTTLLRADLTMVPIALGTMMAIGALTRGAQRPFPGALPGAIVAALVTVALALVAVPRAAPRSAAAIATIRLK